MANSCIGCRHLRKEYRHGITGPYLAYDCHREAEVHVEPLTGYRKTVGVLDCREERLPWSLWERLMGLLQQEGFGALQPPRCGPYGFFYKLKSKPRKRS